MRAYAGVDPDQAEVAPSRWGYNEGVKQLPNFCVSDGEEKHTPMQLHFPLPPPLIRQELLISDPR